MLCKECIHSSVCYKKKQVSDFEKFITKTLNKVSNNDSGFEIKSSNELIPIPDSYVKNDVITNLGITVNITCKDFKNLKSEEPDW